jgi:hypothetical protein
MRTLPDPFSSGKRSLFPVWYKRAFEGYGAMPQSEWLIISDWMEKLKKIVMQMANGEHL